MSSGPLTLFVSHDAWRNGAQLFLLNLVRWVKANTDLPFEIACKGSGPLVEDFRAVAPTRVHQDDPAAAADLRARIAAGEFGLVYANTMACGDFLELLQPACPVVAHVHELEQMIQLVGVDIFERTRAWADTIIAVSAAVRDNLAGTHGVPSHQLELIHECIPIREDEAARVKAGAAGLRAALGLPADAFVVGGSGTTDWRKGPDLFVQLARQVLARGTARPAYFVWVGGDGAGREYSQLMHDVERAGLGGRVRFLGSTTTPLDHFAVFDAFALTSREDPYPLVVLEAASLGLPVLCFRGSGGIPEFVDPDCGSVVPYLAVDHMADQVCTLAAHPAIRLAQGRRGAAKVRARHSLAGNAPRIVGLIRDLAARGPARRAAA